MPASSSALAANTTSSTPDSRVVANEDATTSAMVRALATGRSGSRRCTASVSGFASNIGSPVVRSTTYASRTALPFVTRPHWSCGM